MPETEFPDAFKRHVHILASYLRRTVWAGEYDMSLVFRDADDDEVDGGAVPAEINVNSVYLFFQIRVTKHMLEDWQEKNYGRVAKYILHEVCHILIDPVKQLAMRDAAPSQMKMFQEIVERQVCRVTNTIDLLLPKDYGTPEFLEKWAGESNLEMLHGAADEPRPQEPESPQPAYVN